MVGGDEMKNRRGRGEWIGSVTGCRIRWIWIGLRWIVEGGRGSNTETDWIEAVEWRQRRIQWIIGYSGELDGWMDDSTAISGGTMETLN